MFFNIIVAKDKNGAIGKDGKIPWHYPEDLKFFKETTIDCPIIMGRRTYESLPFKDGLPDRINIILSRQDSYKVSKKCNKFTNLDEVLYFLDSIKYYEEYNIDGFLTAIDIIYDECFIIGGYEIYKLFLDHNLVDRIYISNIPEEIEGADTFFPELEEGKWEQEKEYKLDNITVDLLKKNV